MKRLFITVAMLLVLSGAANAECKVSMAQYKSLPIGISYSKAVTILGCEGSEMWRMGFTGSSESVIYTWDGNTKVSLMFVNFINDVLTSKSQSGLQ